MRRYFVLISAIIMLMCLVSSPGFSLEYHWIGLANSNWNDSGNWLEGSPPASPIDDVVISTTSTGNYPITTLPITITNLTIDGAGADLTILAGSVTLMGDVNLINGGALNHNTSDILVCGGNWNDSGGIFVPSTGTVIMNGLSNTITTGASNWFNNLIIEPISAGIITVSNELFVQGDLFIGANGELWLENIATNNHNVQGAIAVDGNLTFQNTNLWTYGNVNIYTGGTLDIGQGGCLYLSNTLFVDPGGNFSAYRVDISSSLPGAYYTIDVSGNLNWDDVTLTRCSGTYISPTATVLQMLDVEFLESDGNLATAHLTIDRTGIVINENYTFDLINFDYTKGYSCHLIGGSNIRVEFINYGGMLSGDTYEWEDGGAVIDWDMGTSPSIDVDITFPQDGGAYNTPITSIQGTANGNVSKVEVSIGNTTDSTYWDGSGWSGSEIDHLASGISAWSYDTSAITWQDYNTYKVQVWAEDSMSTTTVSKIATFVYDTSPPYTTTITQPTDGTTYDTFTRFYGQAYDIGSGVSEVEIKLSALKNGTTFYWNCTEWSTEEVWVVASGTTDWEYLFNDTWWLQDADYTLEVCTIDKAGNMEIQPAICNFNVYPTVVLESIYGTVRKIDGTPITGIIIIALQNGAISANTTTETDGSFVLEQLPSGWYGVEASWIVDDLISSVRQLVQTGTTFLDFTLAIDYELAIIEGELDGLETYATSNNPSKLCSKSLSPKAGLAFVELKKDKRVIVRVAVDSSGHYQIPNLLPGRYTARAYNGKIYSRPQTIKIKEGQSHNIDFTFPLELEEESVYNYPNPAKDNYTVIRYSCLNSNHKAQIRIFTISGELVKEVGDGDIDKTQAPVYEYRWELENDRGNRVASGIYIYLLELEEKSSGEVKQVKKKLAVIR